MNTYFVSGIVLAYSYFYILFIKISQYAGGVVVGGSSWMYLCYYLKIIGT